MNSLTSAFEECRVLNKHYGTRFYHAIHLFPRPLQPHIHGLCAFDRILLEMIRNPIEGVTEKEQIKAMKAWQKAFEKGMHGSGEKNAYLHAALHTTKIFSIDPKYFSHLAKSRIDLHKKKQFQTYTQLNKSLETTSTKIAEILCSILQIHNQKAKKQVVRLAKAGELIELLCDFSKAQERGKMYLPTKDLKKFGYTKQSLERKKVTKAWKKLIESYLQKAEADIKAGLKNTSHFPEHSQVAFITIAQTYQHLIDNIREKEYDLFTYQPKLHWKLKLKQSLPLITALAR